MQFSRRAAVVVTLLLVLALGGCGGSSEGDPTVLRMGLIPADDAAEMIRNYEPVAEYLENKLDLKLEIQVTADYTAAIEAMRNKHIDMAWFGPFSYILAVEEADAEALVNGVRRDTGVATYRSIFVTRADSGIASLDDLKGRSFAFVDPASTSGNLIPRKILLEHGIDPDTAFSTTYFASTHNSVELAVKNGTVDAGADSDNSYDRMVASGDIDPAESVIIYKSEPIPGSPIAVRGGLSKDLKDKIRQALIDMDQQTIYQVQGWGNIERYQIVNDSDYDIIRETAELLGLKD
jgi:phosphonate transport system substrate-binding protein